MGKLRHVYPGGNTALGFYSFYEYILSPQATRLMIIKGGPGVGKSTFMRKISETFVDKGYTIEHHHCSSDPGSLDGIVITELGIALIDGTAPHVVDPQYPGGFDEIINLGAYWDEAGIRANKAQIQACNQTLKALFNRAYGFLRAAKAIHDNWEATVTPGVDFAKVNQHTAALEAEIFAHSAPSPHLGQARHLFASAITPEGPRHQIESLVEPMAHQYVLTGDPGTGKSTLLARLSETALACGYNIEVFHCALDPAKLEHLIIPALNAAVTTSVPPHTYQPPAPKAIIDLGNCVAPAWREKYAAQVATDAELFEHLLNKAVQVLKQAKATHDLLESYYIPHMDFAAIDALCTQTIERIEGYALEKMQTAYASQD